MHSFSLLDRSNADLLASAQRYAGDERASTAFLIAILAEIDARRLYLEQGCSSLFKYCTEVLHLSESSAYRRIEAARLARRYPIVFELLAEGAIHLTTVMVLGSCLTQGNHRDLLEAARHKSKEDLERLAVSVRPKPPVPPVIRKLPERAASSPELGLEEGASVGAESQTMAEAAPGREVPGEHSAIPARPAPPRKPIISPLSPESYKIQFTASAETCRKLRQLQELLRHQVPNGDPAVIIDRALGLLLEQVTREKLARVKQPRRKAASGAGVSTVEELEMGRATSEGHARNSRHIPSEVKRAVWKRDSGQCAFVSKNGRRCSERGRLEFHHVVPYAHGGEATIKNIALRCRAHNAHEGELIFGRNGKKFTRSGASSTVTADAHAMTYSGESRGDRRASKSYNPAP